MSDGESVEGSEPNVEFQTLDSPQTVIGIFVVAAVLPFFCAMGACFGAEDPVYSVAAAAITVGAVATFFAVRFAKAKQIDIAIDSEKIRRVGTDGEETVISWSEPHEVWFDGVQYFAGPVPAGTHRETKVVAPDGRRINMGMAKKEAHDAVVDYSTAAS